MNLTEFLTARIEEDETMAREAPAHAVLGDLTRYSVDTAPPFFLLTTREVVLAECEAKRRIIAMMKGSPDFHDAMPRPGYAQPFHSPSIDVLIRVQQLLALSYADHPDYREEWRP